MAFSDIAGSRPARWGSLTDGDAKRTIKTVKTERFRAKRVPVRVKKTR